MELDPEVYRYSEVRPSVLNAPDPATLRKKIRSEILSGSPRHFWVVEWKDQPGLLGLAGLAPNPFEMGTNALGFRLVRTAWGQGIATEAARAILDHGFRVLNCPTVAAFSHKENWRSHRILDKIGMKRDRIAVLHPRCLLSAPQSRALAGASDLLSVNSSTGIVYMFYRLDRGTYLDRVGPPTASDLLR